MPSRSRPSSVTAAAVLAIIYGSLGILCGFWGSAGITRGGGNDPIQQRLQKELDEAVRRKVPAYKAVQIWGTAIGLAECVALLVAGIGLVNLCSWAPILTLVGCLVAMASAVVHVVYQTFFVMPVISEAFDVELPAAMPNDVAPEVLSVMKTLVTSNAIGTFLVYVVIIVYLLFILLLLGGTRARAAFAAGPGYFDAIPDDKGIHPGFAEDRHWDRARRSDHRDDWRYK